MKDLSNSSSVRTRRFAIYPIIKDAKEDLALQQIQLREDYCLSELYPTDSNIVQGKFYYYVNSSGVESLICEVRVLPDKYSKLSEASRQCFFNELSSEALRVEKTNKIIMEGIRTPYHAEDYIRKSRRAIMSWLALPVGA